MTEAPPPVGPLEYAQARRSGLPGILTAVGIISIVIGCISALANLSGALSGVGYYMMSRMPTPVVAPPPPPATMPTPTPAPATGRATTGGMLSTVNVVVGPGGTTVTTGGAGGAPMPVGNPFSTIHPVAAILSIITSLLGLGLAIYLFIIGILTLRYSPQGARLHWWYVLLKIPLVLFATAAGLWVTVGMARGMNAAMGAGGGPPTPIPMMALMAVSTVMGACLSLAYPIGLIFVLRSKTVRDYYGAIRE